jgi:hypothetical protein
MVIIYLGKDFNPLLCEAVLSQAQVRSEHKFHFRDLKFVCAEVLTTEKVLLSSNTLSEVTDNIGGSYYFWSCLIEMRVFICCRFVL